ncbi:MAG TPA: alpha/beta fold hydrolase [Solirubrobacteraceae bacterium]|nr:alpha/beta fold hydrolase [Solirubrobacteraceae bacterium]
MQVTQPTESPIPESCATQPSDNAASPEQLAPIDGLIENGEVEASEARMRPELRTLLQAAVGAGDAKSLLEESAKRLAFGFAGVGLQSFAPPELIRDGTALADLSVSGRAMLASFTSLTPTAASLAGALSGDPAVVSAGLTQAQLMAGAAGVITRTHQVLAALLGPARTRAGLRTALAPTWVCVSGEDDSPYRPVNVPTAPFPQFDITVTVPTPMSTTVASIPVTTRFMVATSGALPAETVTDPTLGVEMDPAPRLPEHGPVFLYIHGHMSRLEEALDLTEALHAITGTTTFFGPGAPCTVIAVDLPNMGYAEMISHTEVAPLAVTQYPTGYPILDFIESFIIGFVEALQEDLNLSERLTAVIGGSLGGHMGLRLSRRANEVPWLRHIAAWSPASVWQSLADQNLDIFKDIALGVARGNAAEPEEPESRKNYFTSVYTLTWESAIQTVFGSPVQPLQWYRDTWQPCKETLITASHIDRREIYTGFFRQWHWRSALEMLLYSFLDPDVGETAPRYATMSAEMLLASGADDNYNFANIYTSTQVLARLMTATSGTTLFLLETGHSIHNERPKELATGILDLVTGTPLAPSESPFTLCTVSEAGIVGCLTYKEKTLTECTSGFESTRQECTQQAEEGYSECSATAEEGYSECCTWWPCDWACDALVWVSNVVCVAWTWVSNWVCVAWATISEWICTLWTTLVDWICSVWEIAYNVVC